MPLFTVAEFTSVTPENVRVRERLVTFLLALPPTEVHVAIVGDLSAVAVSLVWNVQVAGLDLCIDPLLRVSDRARQGALEPYRTCTVETAAEPRRVVGVELSVGPIDRVRESRGTAPSGKPRRSDRICLVNR